MNTLVTIYFCSPRLGHMVKTNCKKTSDSSSKDVLNFNSEKNLGLLSPVYFVHDFLRKVIIMLYSFN